MNIIRHQAFVLDQKVVIFLFYCALISIAIYSGLKLNILLSISDELYSFRSDNFWSYSSRIIRRGLTGELIYNLDLLTGRGPKIFSIIIWITYLFFLRISMLEIRKNLSGYELVAFLISPLFLLYFVDSEIFVLLPFITLFSSNRYLQTWGALFLIVISTLIKEISILFFAPVIFYYILNSRPKVRIVYVLTMIFLIIYLIAPKPAPTFLLEDHYWITKGIHVKNTHLYRFTSMSFSKILMLHAHFIISNFYLFLLPVMLFLMFIVSLFYVKSRSILASCYLLLMTSFCFILTVDYGRYFYLFVFYVALASHPNTVHYFSFLNVNNYVVKNFSVNALSTIDRILIKIWEYRLLILILIALSPSGIWAAEYQLMPRAYTLVSDELGRFINLFN